MYGVIYFLSPAACEHPPQRIPRPWRRLRNGRGSGRGRSRGVDRRVNHGGILTTAQVLRNTLYYRRHTALDVGHRVNGLGEGEPLDTSGAEPMNQRRIEAKRTVRQGVDALRLQENRKLMLCQLEERKRDLLQVANLRVVESD
jgi:hypothetical protein